MSLSESEKLLTDLEEVALEEAKSLLQQILPGDTSKSRLREILALLVIQTACEGPEQEAPEQKSNKKKKSAGSTGDKHRFLDEKFHPHYVKLFDMFAERARSANVNGETTNYGRPLLRLIDSSDQTNEVAGGVGDHVSQFLWELTERIALEVPKKYSKGCEGALLYLSAADASSSFRKSCEKDSEKVAIELPCLIEMLGKSGSNNKNNFSAFMSEYVALLHISLDQEFIGEEFTCKSVKEYFDFSIDKQNNRSQSKVNFSVKTMSGSTKYFGDQPAYYGECLKFAYAHGNQGSQQVTEATQANIYLYPCSNVHCLAQPVRKVELILVVTGRNRRVDTTKDFRSSSVCEKCSGKIEPDLEYIESEIRGNQKLQDGSKVIIYLVSTQLSNDIQSAVQKRCFKRKFELEKFHAWSMKESFGKPKSSTSQGRKKEDPDSFPVLVDRSYD